MKPKHPNSMEETYESVRLLIYKIAHNFVNQYGGELDDAIGLANLRFVLAYNSFDPSKDLEFSRWMYIVVWGGLKNSLKPWRQVEPRPTETSSFNMTDFLDELTEDAQHIIELLFDTPRDLAHLFCYHEGTAKQNKNVIKNYLLERDWQSDRIDNSFLTIRTVLR